MFQGIQSGKDFASLLDKALWLNFLDNTTIIRDVL